MIEGKDTTITHPCVGISRVLGTHDLNFRSLHLVPFLIRIARLFSFFPNSPQTTSFPETAHRRTRAHLRWSTRHFGAGDFQMFPLAASSSPFPSYSGFLLELVYDAQYAAFFLEHVVSISRAQWQYAFCFPYYFSILVNYGTLWYLFALLRIWFHKVHILLHLSSPLSLILLWLTFCLLLCI